MIPFFGASVYDDPAVYAKSSPINFVKKVKTPTLIVVGDRDGEVPAPQSYEWYHALKTLGVPTQLVVYPDEGHAIRKPEHRRDMMERTVQWFDRWLRAENPAKAADFIQPASSNSAKGSVPVWDSSRKNVPALSSMGNHVLPRTSIFDQREVAPSMAAPRPSIDRVGHRVSETDRLVTECC